MNTPAPKGERLRPLTPAENLEVLAARLSEHLSPAEKREIQEAITALSPVSAEVAGLVEELLDAAHGAYKADDRETTVSLLLQRAAAALQYSGQKPDRSPTAETAGWVSVEDRLPESGAHCWIWFKGADMATLAHLNEYANGTKHWKLDNGNKSNDALMEEISYWQPARLPAASAKHDAQAGGEEG